MTRLLLNPGPTNVAPEVKQCLLSQDTNHREADFVGCLHSVRARLLRLAGGDDDFCCIPLFGSGTAANEAVLQLFHGGQTLTLSAGRYGARLHKIARQIQLPVSNLNFDPLQGIDPAIVEDALRRSPEIRSLVFAHHETTSTLLAPLDELCAIARRYDVVTAVDTISSLYGHSMALSPDGPDFCTVTSNKCLEGVPGISFVFARTAVLQSLAGLSRSFYFDLHAHWHRFEQGDTLPRFTMPTNVVFATEVAVERLESETVAGRSARYRRLKDTLRRRLEALGFRGVEMGDAPTASMLQFYHLPPAMDFAHFRAYLAERDVLVYSDQPNLAAGRFFLATMGAIEERDLDRFVSLTRHYVGDRGTFT